MVETKTDVTKRILIVDDEKEIREMLSRHFSYNGYDVLTADNGKIAIETLEKERIHLVISDIIMPEINGPDLLRTIKDQYPMIKVIMITGYVTLENALACMRRGAETLIFKPIVDLDELDAVVDAAFESLLTWNKKLKELQSLKG